MGVQQVIKIILKLFSNKELENTPQHSCTPTKFTWFNIKSSKFCENTLSNNNHDRFYLFAKGGPNFGHNHAALQTIFARFTDIMTDWISQQVKFRKLIFPPVHFPTSSSSCQIIFLPNNTKFWSLTLFKLSYNVI